MNELDLGLEPDPVEGADQIGGEHEAALEDRDDEQVLGLRAAISWASSSMRLAIVFSSKRTRMRGEVVIVGQST